MRGGDPGEERFDSKSWSSKWEQPVLTSDPQPFLLGLEGQGTMRKGLEGLPW